MNDRPPLDRRLDSLALPADADLDAVYRALSVAERRTVLRHLLDRDVASIEELADVLAGRRAVESGTMVGPERRDRLAVKLWHRHLPTLERAGLVEVIDERVRLRVDEGTLSLLLAPARSEEM